MKVKTQYKKNDNNSIVLNMNDWDKLNTEIISLSSHKHHSENFKVLSEKQMKWSCNTISIFQVD